MIFTLLFIILVHTKPNRDSEVYEYTITSTEPLDLLPEEKDSTITIKRKITKEVQTKQTTPPRQHSPLPRNNTLDSSNQSSFGRIFNAFVPGSSTNRELCEIAMDTDSLWLGSD